MTVVLGYADRQAVRAGETLRIMVSVEGADSYAAEVFRLTGPAVGEGPDVPAFAPVALASAIDGNHRGGVQDNVVGSCAVVDAAEGFAALDDFSLAVFVQPTLPAAGGQAIAGTLNRAVGSGFALWLDADGVPCLAIAGADGAVRILARGRKLALRRWAFVAVSVDAASGRILLYQRRMERHRQESAGEFMTEIRSDAAIRQHAGPFVLGAVAGDRLRRRWRISHVFNGRLQRPLLFGRALGAGELRGLADAGPAGPAREDAVADWDFSLGIDSEEVTDVSGHGYHGRTVNLPSRGVTGCNWAGNTIDWRRAPEQYGAIHFHDDDLDDADWDVSLDLPIPPEWRGGCHAVRLTAGASEFWVPFAILPPAGECRADVVFLVPTCTYAAYANMNVRVNGQWNEMIHGRLTVIDETDLLMLDHPTLGRSTYDVHSDGSIVLYSTMRRPVTNCRPTGRIYKFCQDLLIIAYLEHLGIAYDVTTDDVLHEQGAAALDGYRVLITGSHPEYYTTAMLDAVEGFLGAGGRMMYLGGNGFFWRTAYHPRLPGVVEVRRIGLDRIYSTDETEGHFSLTGEPGGTWLKQGRPPNMICGVGFITQGFDACEAYIRTAASRDPRAAFIFAGVEGEAIGDFGLLMGGASGYEIDRFDPALGSPSHALVLASSREHSNLYELMISSIMELLPRSDPDAPDPIRADLVFFETPSGGAVFSTGSIAWCGSLAHAGYRNSVAQVTGNVLRRFLDAAAFECPAAQGSTA